MKTSIQVNEVTQLDLSSIAELIESSKNEGFNHLLRLQEEYKNGLNRFTNPGEVLFIAKSGDKIIGICGLTRDPYQRADVGRVRRLYVLPEFRNKGIGKVLTKNVISKAVMYFNQIELKTDNEMASIFYKNLGFKETESSKFTTHILELKRIT
jgi:ribosomal protein S18 acetylase RimI-like enzyme